MRYGVRVILAMLSVAVLASAMPASASAVDEQAEIVQIAYAHIGDKFKIGANGPNRFDCSGFLWYVFSTADLADKIGGKPLTARGFQRYFRNRGLLFTDPKQARVGDLAFYGNPAQHSAIVTRIDNKGRPRITSALTIGVKETKYNTLNVPFNSFAHVGLGLEPTPTPTPTPTPSSTPTPSPSPTVDPTPSSVPSSSASEEPSPSAAP